MFKQIFFFCFSVTVICSIAWIPVSEAQLQPITTSVICSTVQNCATANLRSRGGDFAPTHQQRSRESPYRHSRHTS